MHDAYRPHHVEGLPELNSEAFVHVRKGQSSSRRQDGVREFDRPRGFNRMDPRWIRMRIRLILPRDHEQIVIAAVGCGSLPAHEQERKERKRSGEHDGNCQTPSEKGFS